MLVDFLGNTMKPMLASKVEKPERDIAYPVLCTPKIDGIRCLTFADGAPKSRSLKNIPNFYIQEKMKEYGVEGMDGELWIPGAGTFGEVSSAVMKQEGEPDFEYIVFDLYNIPGEMYKDRVKALDNLPKPRPPWLKILKPVEVYDAEGFINYWNKCVDDGFEGVIARQAGGLYKYGKATGNEQLLLKYKHFEDDEAEVIGFVEMCTNTNPKTINLKGETERSSAKAGKVPNGKLGKWLCRDLKTGVEFSIGTMDGVTLEQRKEWWDNRQIYIGWVCKYKHQGAGATKKPRFPVWLGWRDKRDM